MKSRSSIPSVAGEERSVDQHHNVNTHPAHQSDVNHGSALGTQRGAAECVEPLDYSMPKRDRDKDSHNIKKVVAPNVASVVKEQTERTRSRSNGMSDDRTSKTTSGLNNSNVVEDKKMMKKKIPIMMGRVSEPRQESKDKKKTPSPMGRVSEPRQESKDKKKIPSPVDKVTEPQQESKDQAKVEMSPVSDKSSLPVKSLLTHRPKRNIIPKNLVCLKSCHFISASYFF